MMGEIAKLIDPTYKGVLDEADYKQTVDTLLASKSGENPAITKAPDAGAFTHAVTDKSSAM
jgi:NitT/TauT family transport system substrate-binding protein